MTVHKLLVDGSVRELYKAIVGAWGGNKVNKRLLNTFVKCFLKKLSKK